ncbi:MAG: chemotaxis protein CheW [Candidatus Kapaibacterium sp.]
MHERYISVGQYTPEYSAFENENDIYLSFRIARESCAVPAARVLAIVEDASDFRNKSEILHENRRIPLISLGDKMNINGHCKNERPSIIIIDTGGQEVGIMTDSAPDVMLIPRNEIDARIDESRCCISGIGKSGGSIRLIIDCDRLGELL